MPVYCYKKEDGESIEKVMTCAEKDNKEFMHNGKKSIFLDNGEIAYRDIEIEFKGTRSFPGNWPLLSEAFGCGEGQEAECYQKSVEMGVPVEYVNGKAIFKSADHRRKALKAFGMHDRSAYC